MIGASFIVPCLNEEALIEGCLTSILREIYRTSIPAEIIVVDNGCDDRTVEIVKALDNRLIRIVFEPCKGIVWARQKGADEARYDILANIDADNELPEGWLKQMLTEMSRPGVVAVSGPLIYRETPRWFRAASRLFYWLAWVVHHSLGPMLQGGNYALSRSALQRAGGYDTSVEFFGEDTVTANRLSSVGKVAFVMDLKAYSSSRRYEGDGIIKTTARYVINYFTVTFRGRPHTLTHNDLRNIVPRN